MRPMMGENERDVKPPLEPQGLPVAGAVSIPWEEIELRAVRSQGAGGQHVNKVATAVHLRFDVKASSLPEELKKRLLELRDRRITRRGVIVIKAQQQRSQERNRAEALRRLQALVAAAAKKRRNRRPTHPAAGAQRRRLDAKSRHGRLKAARRRVDGADPDA